MSSATTVPAAKQTASYYVFGEGANARSVAIPTLDNAQKQSYFDLLTRAYGAAKGHRGTYGDERKLQRFAEEIEAFVAPFVALGNGSVSNLVSAFAMQARPHNKAHFEVADLFSTARANISVFPGAPSDYETLTKTVDDLGKNRHIRIKSALLAKQAATHASPSGNMPGYEPRFAALVAALADMDIFLDDINVTTGASPALRDSYILVDIPCMNRQIALTDRNDGKTYVHHNIGSPAFWADFTPSAGVRNVTALSNDLPMERWLDRVLSALDGAKIDAGIKNRRRKYDDDEGPVLPKKQSTLKAGEAAPIIMDGPRDPAGVAPAPSPEPAKRGGRTGWRKFSVGEIMTDILAYLEENRQWPIADTEDPTRSKNFWWNRNAWLKNNENSSLSNLADSWVQARASNHENIHGQLPDRAAGPVPGYTRLSWEMVDDAYHKRFRKPHSLAQALGVAEAPSGQSAPKHGATTVKPEGVRKQKQALIMPALLSYVADRKTFPVVLDFEKRPELGGRSWNAVYYTLRVKDRNFVTLLEDWLCEKAASFKKTHGHGPSWESGQIDPPYAITYSDADLALRSRRKGVVTLANLLANRLGMSDIPERPAIAAAPVLRHGYGHSARPAPVAAVAARPSTPPPPAPPTRDEILGHALQHLEKFSRWPLTGTVKTMPEKTWEELEAHLPQGGLPRLYRNWTQSRISDYAKAHAGPPGNLMQSVQGYKMLSWGKLLRATDGLPRETSAAPQHKPAP